MKLLEFIPRRKYAKIQWDKYVKSQQNDADAKMLPKKWKSVWNRYICTSMLIYVRGELEKKSSITTTEQKAAITKHRAITWLDQVMHHRCHL